MQRVTIAAVSQQSRNVCLEQQTTETMWTLVTRVKPHHMGCIGLAFAACVAGQDAAPSSQATVSTAERTVAVTFDDLPFVVPRLSCDSVGLVEFTDYLLRTISRSDVPVTAFVNESKICARLRAELMPVLLTSWIDAGHELGNHTYSHRAFHADPGGQPDPSLVEYADEILRGEAITRPLLATHGAGPRYFRHPYLRTGPPGERKDSLEVFLTDHGYKVAPVTIDNSEWIYAGAYARAQSRSDSAAARRIGTAYLEHMEEMFEFFEGLSRDVIGREVAQVLLVHANELNADYFDQLVANLRIRGYRFVTLDEALADPAYARGDVYTGERGRSWLQRWFYADHGEIREEPAVPNWVVEALEGRDAP